jgi:hypothetical protein
VNAGITSGCQVWHGREADAYQAGVLAERERIRRLANEAGAEYIARRTGSGAPRYDSFADLIAGHAGKLGESRASVMEALAREILGTFRYCGAEGQAVGRHPARRVMSGLARAEISDVFGTAAVFVDLALLRQLRPGKRAKLDAIAAGLLAGMEAAIGHGGERLAREVGPACAGKPGAEPEGLW